VHLRDLNWIGEGALDDEVKRGERLDVFVKVRSSRPPQAAWLAHGDGGFEVEFVGGEEGVAPGQACVLYDAAGGQARMLGGGFIRSAVSQGEMDAIPAMAVPTVPLAAR
jgi:tRNA-specific 2-thiouridylase